MEFHIGREELNRALGRVQGIVERRSTNPILGNVWLRVSESGVRMLATDTEVSLVGDYPAQVTTPGQITLGAKYLLEIARSLPGDTLHFRMPDAGGLDVEIRAGRSLFTLRGLPASEFPPLVEEVSGQGFLITAVHLRELIENTIFAISTDDTRTGLNGACVQRVNGWNGAACVRFVSTDGHRLSLCDRPFTGEFDPPGGLLLPRKGLGELKKLCDEADAVFEVLISEREAVFRRGSLTFSMRLLEGEFPDYPQVIPESWQRRVRVHRGSLVDALRRVSIMSAEKASHSVSFKVGDGTLGLSSRQTDRGSAVDEIEAEVTGDPLEIGFNARYFLDVLSVMTDDIVVLELGDTLSPCLVKPGSTEDRLFVVMPMRLE